jgi:hypothetical protein
LTQVPVFDHGALHLKGLRSTPPVRPFGHGGQVFTGGRWHCPAAGSLSQNVCPGVLWHGCGVLLHLGGVLPADVGVSPSCIRVLTQYWELEGGLKSEPLSQGASAMPLRPTSVTEASSSGTARAASGRMSERCEVRGTARRMYPSYRGFKRNGGCVHVFLKLYNIIVVMLYQTFFMVLKDALAHLGPYQTLKKVWYNDPGGENTVPLPATIQI